MGVAGALVGALWGERAAGERVDMADMDQEIADRSGLRMSVERGWVLCLRYQNVFIIC